MRELSENAKTVLDNRYRQKNERGEFTESYDDIWRRVAKNIASAEKTEELRTKWEEIFYEELKERNFVPNTPTLINAGTSSGLGYGACYVIGMSDTIVSDKLKKILIDDKEDGEDTHGITDAIQATAIIQKASGGTGFTLDHLRPTGDWISTSQSKSGGPIAFWYVIAAISAAMQQGGKRRGANMMTMSLWHPDILKFITAKDEFDSWMTEVLGYKARRFGNFNISVKISDHEFELITKHPDTPFIVRNPRTNKEYYIPKAANIKSYLITELEEVVDALRGFPKGVSYTYGEVWDMICQRAWEHADPGIIYIDRIKERNHLPVDVDTTNPCSEQALESEGVCNLSSIDLSKFVSDKRLDKLSLKKSWHNMIRFLDNVIDASPYPMIPIKENALKWRRIGAGVMGVADMLMVMELPYNSKEATEICKDTATFLMKEAIIASENLSKEKGPAPGWESTSLASKVPPRRNCYLTSVQPTGTVSIIAGCVGGIEPAFSLAFNRHIMRDHTGKAARTKLEVNPHFNEALTKAIDKYISGDTAKKQLKSTIISHALKEGTIQNLDIDMVILGSLKGVDQDKLALSEEWSKIKEVFKTAHDISWKVHVDHQAVWTKYLTQLGGGNGISKTTNMPSSAAVQEVKDMYTYAWKEGCIGITMYRDKSHDGQPMALDEDKVKDEKNEKIYIAAPARRKVPDVTDSVKVSIPTAVGNLHVNVSYEDSMPVEVFAQVGKGGQDVHSLMEAIGRCISIGLQHGIEFDKYVDQLKGIGTTRVTFGNGGKYVSIPDALGKAMERSMKHRIGKYDNEDNKPLLEPALLTVASPSHAAITFKLLLACANCAEYFFSESDLTSSIH